MAMFEVDQCVLEVREVQICIGTCDNNCRKLIDIEVIISYYLKGILRTIPLYTKMTFDLYQGHRGQGKKYEYFNFVNYIEC